MSQINCARVMLAITLTCFVALSYTFGVAPDNPQPGDPNCVNTACRQVNYWWINGDATTQQCGYHPNDPNQMVRIAYAVTPIWVSNEVANNGPANTPDFWTVYTPSSTKRICNGATNATAEQIVFKDGNVDTATAQQFLGRTCKLPQQPGG
jgi:hypothetical protein